MPAGDAERLVRNQLAERVGEGGGRETQESRGEPSFSPPPPSPAEPDPRLVSFLNTRGFRRLADRPAWTKHDKVGGRIVRLVVDFKANPGGNRYGYVLNEETGEWEESRELRDAAEDLLAFKRFRDELERGGRERLTVKPVPKPGGAPAGGQALTVEEGQELILMVEQRDEQQIMQEILGDVLRQYVYRFEVGGRVVTNVSYAGIKEAARRRGNVHVTKVEVEETKDGQAVIGKAEVYDLQNNFKTWGVAVQRKRMRLRDGREVEDDFCVQKAVSKVRPEGRVQGDPQRPPRVRPREADRRARGQVARRARRGEVRIWLKSRILKSYFKHFQR
ncbi:MAG: hypothetical protein JRE40_07685 [Deltaproteobacteria bacterium]|nr:hypothetical protein [Deltaproteobacteria bacterium]